MTIQVDEKRTPFISATREYFHGALRCEISYQKVHTWTKKNTGLTVCGQKKRYYEFATAAYEMNWSTRFHYAPFSPTDTLHSAQCFYEHRVALLLGLKPGMKVLDVGCGIGGPAREMARFTGCEVVGMSINQAQIDRAIRLTAEEGLTDKCTFVRGDFLVRHLPPSHTPNLASRFQTRGGGEIALTH